MSNIIYLENYIESVSTSSGLLNLSYACSAV